MIRARNDERGIALIIVIFIVALASIIVINLAYSTDLAGRRNVMVERSLQAEYLLKSGVNLARFLISQDETPEDSSNDVWGKFGDGLEVPADLLGITEPNIRVYLEIRPEDAKFRISRSSGFTDPWRSVLLRLFRELGFDDDTGELDTFGPARGEHSDAEALVGRLIDYQDADNESFNPGGIESTLAEENRFPNRAIKRVEELAEIPGFTPNRIRKLLPVITAAGQSRVNINFAPKLVLRVLHEEMTDEIVDRIDEYRRSEEGPFRSENRATQLSSIMGEDMYTQISSLIDTRSDRYQVVAKVDYGTVTYFIRADLSKGGTGSLPDILGMELY